MHTKSMCSIHTTSCSLHSRDTITRVVVLLARGLILLRIVVICMGLVCTIYTYMDIK